MNLHVSLLCDTCDCFILVLHRTERANLEDTRKCTCLRRWFGRGKGPRAVDCFYNRSVIRVKLDECTASAKDEARRGGVRGNRARKVRCAPDCIRILRGLDFPLGHGLVFEQCIKLRIRIPTSDSVVCHEPCHALNPIMTEVHVGSKMFHFNGFFYFDVGPRRYGGCSGVRIANSRPGV